MSVTLLYTTFPDAKTAEEVSQHLLEERLIACANLLPQGRSFYRWEGEIRHVEEVVAVLKTTEERIEDVKGFLKSQHPYATPTLVVLPIKDGLPEFLSWVEGEVGTVS